MCVNVCKKTFLIFQQMFIKSVTKTQFEAVRNEETRGEKLYSLKQHCGPFFLLGVLVFVMVSFE